MGQKGQKRGQSGGIDNWVWAVFDRDREKAVCFCCHEPLGPKGGMTKRKDMRNRICGFCVAEWIRNPEAMLYELPRHRKLPKSELFLTSTAEVVN